MMHPTSALPHMVAAVVTPDSLPPEFMIWPAPRKPMPVTTAGTTLTPASRASELSSDAAMTPAVIMQTIMWVLTPADFFAISRS